MVGAGIKKIASNDAGIPVWKRNEAMLYLIMPECMLS